MYAFHKNKYDLQTCSFLEFLRAPHHFPKSIYFNFYKSPMRSMNDNLVINKNKKVSLLVEENLYKYQNTFKLKLPSYIPIETILAFVS